MAKSDCVPGKKWDDLLNVCISSETKTTPEPTAKSPLTFAVKLITMSPATQPLSEMVLSPALWLFVVLATLGSIMALALWFIIYKRQTRLSSTSEDAERHQEPLQKTEPPTKIHPLPSERNCHAEMLQRAAGAPSPCPHLHLGAQTVSGTEGDRGLPACCTMREHRVPLPATELGGTALVTTKTV